MSTPDDPVIQFILDRSTRALVLNDAVSWPYSRLSYSRLEKIGYRLLVLRCAQLGMIPPTRDEARSWLEAQR